MCLVGVSGCVCSGWLVDSVNVQYFANDWCDILSNQMLFSLYVKTFVCRGSYDVIIRRIHVYSIAVVSGLRSYVLFS